MSYSPSTEWLTAHYWFDRGEEFSWSDLVNMAADVHADALIFIERQLAPTELSEWCARQLMRTLARMEKNAQGKEPPLAVAPLKPIGTAR